MASHADPKQPPKGTVSVWTPWGKQAAPMRDGRIAILRRLIRRAGTKDADARQERA